MNWSANIPGYDFDAVDVVHGAVLADHIECEVQQCEQQPENG